MDRYADYQTLRFERAEAVLQIMRQSGSPVNAASAKQCTASCRRSLVTCGSTRRSPPSY